VIKNTLQHALQNSARGKKKSVRGILRYPVR
jgi:hypothetical protein